MERRSSCRGITVFIILSLASVVLNARDSRFTRHGVGPRYWIAYEYCFDLNRPMTELRWKNNIDWIAENFKEYGYDMISNDGWIEAAQTINENGYITRYNSNWEYGFEYWNRYIHDKGLKVGIYYNPLWMTTEAFQQNCKVIGTDVSARSIAGYHPFNGALHWVDTDKPGAEQWIKGYVRYFIDLGAEFLRIDFLENYENNYGTRRYEQALKWIEEEAGDEIFLSLVMPNCHNHAKTELPYGDMLRVSDDCFEGDWNFVSARRRGQVKDRWPQYANVFDGMIAFSDIGKRGQMILDGDFMRLNRLAGINERQFLFSLMIMGGSPLAIADQYDTACKETENVYKNRELLELHDLGFSAKPLSTDIHDINSSRWVGQLPDGDFIVGLFNREDEEMSYGIKFLEELGIESGNAANIRDLWLHKDLGGYSKGYNVMLPPHSCRILRITPSDSTGRLGGMCCSNK